MPIVKPENMNFSMKKLIMIISGLPGTGKTTLALSAPGVLTIDTDEGMARVNPAHRKDASICKTYEEVLADIKAAEGVYQTIVIDTCGALIEYMQDWAMRTDPKASKKDGGFSLQGYGVIKSEFVRLSAELRKKFNVISRTVTTVSSTSLSSKVPPALLSTSLPTSQRTSSSRTVAATLALLLPSSTPQRLHTGSRASSKYRSLVKVIPTTS